MTDELNKAGDGSETEFTDEEQAEMLTYGGAYRVLSRKGLLPSIGSPLIDATGIDLFDTRKDEWMRK